MVAISSGGRLSTTNQPRSSRHFAAVLRPAPDSPLTTATSMPFIPCPLCACCEFARVRDRVYGARSVVPSGAATSFRGVPSGQRRTNHLGGPAADSRHLRYLVHPCLLQLPHRAVLLDHGCIAVL